MERLIHAGIALTALVALASTGTAEAAESSTRASRVVSPHVARMLADASSRYQPEPARSVADAAKAEPASEEVRPANSIVRLPDYLVRSRRLPAAEEVMTRAELEKVAMQKYLGDETSLDRVLNMFSIAGLWAKLPIVGRYPFIVGQYSGRNAGWAVGPRTNEQRAYDRYDTEQRAQRMAELQGLLSPSLKPGATAP